jgi:hypothetical protein
MLNKTKEKLLKEVSEKNSELTRIAIDSAFKDWGFKESTNTGWSESLYGFPICITTKEYPHKELERKFNLLLKHLKLEYFKKEIKETNGCVKESIVEGFRKLKK